VRKVALDESAVISPEPGEDLIAVDDALHTLAAIEPRQARVIELRFFGGMTEEEIAELLEISPDTVLRDWKKAKLWLWRELRHGKRNES
jgi:RNA polymerase sigma factor (sigma-70 family)